VGRLHSELRAQARLEFPTRASRHCELLLVVLVVIPLASSACTPVHPRARRIDLLVLVLVLVPPQMRAVVVTRSTALDTHQEVGSTPSRLAPVMALVVVEDPVSPPSPRESRMASTAHTLAWVPVAERERALVLAPMLTLRRMLAELRMLTPLLLPERHRLTRFRRQSRWPPHRKRS
jgi:hypothetical protein